MSKFVSFFVVVQFEYYEVNHISKKPNQHTKYTKTINETQYLFARVAFRVIFSCESNFNFSFMVGVFVCSVLFIVFADKYCNSIDCSGNYSDHNNIKRGGMKQYTE